MLMIAPASELAQDIGAEARNAAPCGVDETQLLRLIALARERRKQVHSLGDLIAETPEIDDVAAGAQARRPFHEHRRKAISGQPIRQRRAGNSDAGDEHGFVLHVRDNSFVRRRCYGRRPSSHQRFPESFIARNPMAVQRGIGSSPLASLPIAADLLRAGHMQQLSSGRNLTAVADLLRVILD
jgi:hypothetical protein